MRSKQPIYNLIASLCLMALFFQACAFNPPDCSNPQVFCVGFISDVSGLKDAGLNENAWQTIQQSAQQNNFHASAIESLDTREYKKNIDFFINAEYDLIITSGFGFEKITYETALAQPQTLFIGLNQSLPEEETQPNNLAFIQFPEDQAGFLAGALAGFISKTEKVAAILPHQEITAMNWYGQGFLNGAKFSNQKVQINLLYNSQTSFEDSFNDPFWGENAAQNSLQDGADILLIYGGKTAEAAMLTAATQNGLIIGIGKDFRQTLPAVQPALLASIVPHPHKALTQLLLQASQGNFSAGVFIGQFNILISEEQEISAYTLEQLAIIQQQLEQGIITSGVEKETPVDPNDIY